MVFLQVPLHGWCRREMHVNDNVFGAKSLQNGCPPPPGLSQEGGGVLAHQGRQPQCPQLCSSWSVLPGVPWLLQWALAVSHWATVLAQRFSRRSVHHMVLHSIPFSCQDAGQVPQPVGMGLGRAPLLVENAVSLLCVHQCFRWSPA